MRCWRRGNRKQVGRRRGDFQVNRRIVRRGRLAMLWGIERMALVKDNATFRVPAPLGHGRIVAVATAFAKAQAGRLAASVAAVQAVKKADADVWIHPLAVHGGGTAAVASSESFTKAVSRTALAVETQAEAFLVMALRTTPAGSLSTRVAARIGGETLAVLDVPTKAEGMLNGAFRCNVTLLDMAVLDMAEAFPQPDAAVSAMTGRATALAAVARGTAAFATTASAAASAGLSVRTMCEPGVHPVATV